MDEPIITCLNFQYDIKYNFFIKLMHILLIPAAPPLPTQHKGGPPSIVILINRPTLKPSLNSLPHNS